MPYYDSQGGTFNGGYGSSVGNVIGNYNMGGSRTGYTGTSSGGGGAAQSGQAAQGQSAQGQQGSVNAAAAAAAAMAVARAAQAAQQQRQQQSQQSRSPLQNRTISSQGFGNLPETSVRSGPGFNGGLGIQPYGQGHLSAAGANARSMATQVSQPSPMQWAGISGGIGLQPYGQGTRTASRANQISQATQVPGYGMPELPGNIPNQNMHHETAMNGGFGIPGYGMGNNIGLPARQQPSQIAATPRFNGVGGGAGVQAYGNSVRSAEAASRLAMQTQVPQSTSVAARPAGTMPTNYFAMRSALGQLGGPLMPPQTLITAARSAGGNPMPAGGQVVAGPETQPDPPDLWYNNLKNKVGEGLQTAKALGQQVYDLPGTTEQKSAAVKGLASSGLLGATLGYLTGGNPLGFAPSTGLQVYPGSNGSTLSGGGGGNYVGSKKPKKKDDDEEKDGWGKDKGGAPGGTTPVKTINYPQYYSTWAGLPTGPVLG